MAKTTTSRKPNYKIIRIEKQLKRYGFLNLKSYVHDAKITMTKFYAKDDDEAYAYLQDYKRVANKAYDYYYDDYSPAYLTDRKGKKHEFDDVFAKWEFERNDKPWYKKIIENASFNLEYYLLDCPKNSWYWLRDNVFMLKHKHQYGEYWSLDSHILDDLKWNIPLLNKHAHGIAMPYIDKAVCEMHKDEKDFDIREWNKTHHEYTNEEEKLAVKYQEESRNELLKHVKLYEYYRDHGVTDDKELDKKWHFTLPIKKGTYDHFDYKKLDALRLKHWNKIWEWMRMYGETLWD